MTMDAEPTRFADVVIALSRICSDMLAACTKLNEAVVAFADAVEKADERERQRAGKKR